MSDEYSLYDAKAKLSALVRQVREGASFVITVHGQPVAELRPIDNAKSETPRQTLAERLAELDELGAIVPARRHTGEAPHFPVGSRKPGALKRFLEERD